MPQKQIRIQKPAFQKRGRSTSPGTEAGTEQAFDDAPARIRKDKTDALRRDLESEGAAIDEALKERYS